MNDYLEVIKRLKSEGYEWFDYGDSRVFKKSGDRTYTFTYRDKPNSNAEDIIHLMIK